MRRGAPAGHGLEGEDVGVVVAGDLVVGGDDEATRGIQEPGQLVVGDEAVPLVVAVPAGDWDKAVAVSANGDGAGEAVGDVAFAIGVDEILRWCSPVGEGAVEFLPVAGRGSGVG